MSYYPWWHQLSVQQYLNLNYYYLLFHSSYPATCLKQVFYDPDLPECVCDHDLTNMCLSYSLRPSQPMLHSQAVLPLQFLLSSLDSIDGQFSDVLVPALKSSWPSPEFLQLCPFVFCSPHRIGSLLPHSHSMVRMNGTWDLIEVIHACRHAYVHAYIPYFISLVGIDHLLFSSIAIGTETLQGSLGSGRSSSGRLKHMEEMGCLGAR